MKPGLKSSLKIAACQLPDVQMNTEQTLNTMLRYATKAESLSVELVCFPECYLQGYVLDENVTAKLALDLTSPEFQAVLQRLSGVKPTLVFGLIETLRQKLYNTAVVVKQGKLLGAYRKTKLLKGEQLFEAGSSYPVFNIKTFKFGINICYDMNFPECAAALAQQGAHLLVCPSNNMMRYDVAEKWKTKHNESRSQRASESGLWIISADVTGKRDGRISYGPTAVINPQGEVVDQVPLMQEGIVVHEISL